MNRDKLYVLMLEDDPLDVELNMEQLALLEEYDCEVRVVSDRQGFLNALEMKIPDIVLTDYNLPQYSGLEALADFKSRRLLVPLIFVTGALSEEIAAETIKAGAWDYVVKDRLFRLPLAVRAALKHKAERQVIIAAEEKIQRLMAAIDQTSVQIVVLNENRKVEYFNRRFTEMSGLLLEDLFDDQQDKIGGNPHIQEILKHLSAIPEMNDFRGEVKNISKDGTPGWELMSITPIRDRAGKINNYVVIREDITQQKQIQQHLTVALEKAENSDRLKDAFLHNLSHEIRTPLNAIVGFSELLKSSELKIPDFIREYASIIMKSSNQLLTVVTDVLTMASIQTGHEKVIRKKVDMNSLLEVLAGIYKSQAEQKGIQVHFILDNPEIPIRFVTDETKLMQILTNLLDNAFKFTRQGKVELSCRIQGEQLRFMIRDTGIGISKSAQEYIFERFRQADNMIHTTYGGTGLGLAICKSFAQMLGGDISVQSDTGQGAVFYLNLPYIPAATEPQKISVNLGAGQLSQMTILVVEDEVFNYELIKAYFKKTEVKLLYAKNGLEGLRICEMDPEIDLVLMDIQMPVMDGVTAFREIRKFRKDIPVLALTAYAMEDEKKNFIDMGFNGYISKPINKELLFQTINRSILSVS